jgi:preprotein translocase subunit SecE
MSRGPEFSDDEEKSLGEEPSREPVRGEEGGERKARLPKLSFGKRLSEFYNNVKLEMRKTSWPTRNEVWSTTVVVLIAVVFFGFYLFGVDRLITLGFEALEQALK